MNRIKELRKRKGIEQKELAKSLGVTQQTISLYEKGSREPKLATWEKLADFFGVSLPFIQGYDSEVQQKSEPCDYCDLESKNIAVYPLYGANHIWLGMAYLNKNNEIAVNLRGVGTIKADDPVKHCPNCGRELTK